MSALAGIKGVSRVPRREDYEGIVKGFRPLCGGEELMLRSSLLLMRDRAMATKQNHDQSPAGYAILDVVEQVASMEALNHRIPLEELREIQRLCVKCVTVAKDFDRIYQPPLPGIEQGEKRA